MADIDKKINDKEVSELKQQLSVQADSLNQHILLQHKLERRIKELEGIIESENKLKQSMKDIVDEGDLRKYNMLKAKIGRELDPFKDPMDAVVNIRRILNES